MVSLQDGFAQRQAELMSALKQISACQGMLTQVAPSMRSEQSSWAAHQAAGVRARNQAMRF